ncbi:MAG: RelE protein [Candidatus Peregrinibacteria bacterium Greene0416_62]|nr:MAG: RelE protein [Candidatus Peregrinibacteria bacterium Greene0416_62]TSC99709.1 MAG: RelE protein [Candidatus Peregrinibacteria bacterium Greene1014_49]
MYKIIILKHAQKEASTLPQKDQKRISVAITSLATDPFRGKQMHGDYKGVWTIRVWPYRIMYRIEKEMVTVIVLRVGHRKDVYR